jgi:hypothetical protein
MTAVGTWAMTVLAVALAAGGTWALVRGVRRLVDALHHAGRDSASLELVRGIRGIVVGVGLGALAGGLAFGATWLLAFGAVFLAEELYETGVLVLVLRRQARS